MSNTVSKSEFIRQFDFDDIRPYYDHEVQNVLKKIIQEPVFHQLANFIWPGITKEKIEEKAARVNSNVQFQREFMEESIWTILSRYSDGLTWSGLENINNKEAYLYIANHRDILLDSAILQILLVKHGFDTSEITFGNNLMDKGFITDFGRANRMFTVLREGTSKELYKISRKLSAYIRHTIIDKKVSAWIAQRNGRTKDGNDITQTGLLKMLNISGEKDFVENFQELKIVPLTITYEYEPCDFLKVQELYLSSLHSNYKKAPGEDINSIVTGITQYKGRVHMHFGKPIMEELEELRGIKNENEKFKLLTHKIDQQIYKNFRLYQGNYVAADMLENKNTFAGFYTEDDKKLFQQYMNKQIEQIKGEKATLENIFLKIYANPVFNRYQHS